MLRKKRDRFWRGGFIGMNKIIKIQRFIIMVVLLFIITGCGHEPQTIFETMIDNNEMDTMGKNNDMETKDILVSYCSIYDETAEANGFGVLEVIRNIASWFKRNVYTADDRENQIDKTKSEQWAKGYELPVNHNEKEEAETDCRKIMRAVSDIYINADKDDETHITISNEAIHQMVKKVKKTGCPVTTIETYFNMENYKKVEDFLNASLAGNSGSVVVYEIHSDGGIGREKYIFDGMDMYVLSAKASWSDDNKPTITYISCTRLKEWKYTEKGWFCYEMCVPEPPEVTEIIDGSRMIRIKPMSEENREISLKCVLGLGYQGNNLLCSNWDTNHMEDLDYNGMYEYLYRMKYEEKFDSEDYPDGIPKDIFEKLIMEYLPVTSEQIQRYAVFDQEKQTYMWTRLGCFNYAPAFFGTSVPEVTNIKKNQDGTVTLTVDAVCEMILCNDAVITHELTVCFSDNGSLQYLGNKILNDGIMNIPDYQYRISKE